MEALILRGLHAVYDEVPIVGAGDIQSNSMAAFSCLTFNTTATDFMGATVNDNLNNLSPPVKRRRGGAE